VTDVHICSLGCHILGLALLHDWVFDRPEISTLQPRRPPKQKANPLHPLTRVEGTRNLETHSRGVAAA
jgi:hypothetical protein